MPRSVRYRCPDHGVFRVHVRYGHGHGRAPLSLACVTCGAPSVRSATWRSEAYQRCEQRELVVSVATAERAHAYCRAQGITIDALISALIPDVGAQP